MDTVATDRPERDFLSSLPPELLLTIFDLAYDPNRVLLEPLSRRLLPYFRRDFYRRIQLSLRPSWLKLQRTVKALPQLGELVLDLDVSQVFIPSGPCNLTDVMQPFPRLESIKCGQLNRISPSSSIQPLQALSYRCFILRWTELAKLSRFPGLARLEVCFERSKLAQDSIPDTTLATLRHLTLSADSCYEEDSQVWAYELLSLLERTPKLIQLDLSDNYCPYFINYLPQIAHLLPDLTSLRLGTSDLEPFHNITCDRHLPLFPNLQHIDLGDNTVSSSLLSYLRQLPHLSSLRLGYGIYFDGPTSSDMLSLVSGPSRLVKLKKLILDCVSGQLGHRWSLEAMEGATDHTKYGSFEDWMAPAFCARFHPEDLYWLLLRGGQCGIEISGSSVEAIGIWDAYHLEVANRRVMKAFKTKSLDGLKELGGREYHRCPIVEFDKLVPNNLKLVKIDLPEENWFALTLE